MIYLAAGYGVVWLGTFLYVLYLARQERTLEREIRQLQTRLVEGKIDGAGR